MNRKDFLEALAASDLDIDDGPPEARVMLDLAFDLLDDIERMRAELREESSTVTLSERGNTRADPRLAEIRHHTVTLQKVLASLFPKDPSPATLRARKAGQARQRAAR